MDAAFRDDRRFQQPVPPEIPSWPDMVIWRMCDGNSLLEGRLADCGARGFEYRLFIDGRFTCSERFMARHDALRTLSEVQAFYDQAGWWQVYPRKASAIATPA